MDRKALCQNLRKTMTIITSSDHDDGWVDVLQYLKFFSIHYSKRLLVFSFCFFYIKKWTLSSRFAGCQSRQIYNPIIKRYYFQSENTCDHLYCTEGGPEDQKIKWLAQGHAARRKEGHGSSPAVWPYATLRGWLPSPHFWDTVSGLGDQWSGMDEGLEEDKWYESCQNLIGQDNRSQMMATV